MDELPETNPQRLRELKQKQIELPDTEDGVKLALRKMNEPVTLFGETWRERKARLLELLLPLSIKQINKILSEKVAREVAQVERFEKGGDVLLKARREFAKIGWKAVYKRRQLGILKLTDSQVVSTRPLASVKYSSDGVLATTCFGGIVRIQNGSQFDLDTKAGALSWSGSMLAAGSLEGRLEVFSGQSRAQFVGHTQRVASTCFVGDYLISGGYDQTWRIWDVQTQQQVSLQSGHAHGVHSMDFKNQLLVTGGVRDGLARLWDLRTGRNLMVVEPVRDGHVYKSTLTSVSIAQDGVTFATSADDGTCKIHDFRQLKSSLATLMAGGSGGVVSRARFVDNLLLTGSFDGCIRFYAQYYELQEVLRLDSKVMDFDMFDNTIQVALFDKRFITINSVP